MKRFTCAFNAGIAEDTDGDSVPPVAKDSAAIVSRYAGGQRP